MSGATTRKVLTLSAALWLLGHAAAEAHSLRTPPIELGTGEKLVCTIVNVSGRPVQMSAEVDDRSHRNVTDFTFTDWDASETILLTLRVESNNESARYCRFKVKRPTRKSDVRATLHVCTYDDSVCGDPVVAR